MVIFFFFAFLLCCSDDDFDMSRYSSSGYSSAEVRVLFVSKGKRQKDEAKLLEI